jgi:hypothetical protein
VSHDLHEPAHVHIDREDASSKFWVDPVSLARNVGFGPREASEIERLIRQNREVLLKEWNDYFGA